MLMQLPCTTRSYYYLRIKYGEVLLLNETDKVAAYIYNCLRHGRYHKALESHYEKKDWQSFPISLNDFQMFHEQLSISALGVSHINDLLEDKFDDLFYIKTTERVYLRKMGVDDSIVQFMLKHGIDEEVLSLDTLKKRYYRYRKRNEEYANDLIRNNVPNCPTSVNDKRITVRLSSNETFKLKEASKILNMNRSDIVRSLIIKNVSNAQFKTTKAAREQLSLNL